MIASLWAPEVDGQLKFYDFFVTQRLVILTFVTRDLDISGLLTYVSLFLEKRRPRSLIVIISLVFLKLAHLDTYIVLLFGRT